MPQAVPSGPSAGSAASLPDEPFACGFEVEGRAAAWVSPRGALDLASASRFEQVLKQAFVRALLVIVDLRHLTFIDSSGLSVVIEADATARQTGHRLVLIRGGSPVDRRFALVGAFDRLNVLDVTPSPRRAESHNSPQPVPADQA